MIAPATISNCGALLAIMPGIALPRKPRISLSNEIRSGVAMLPPRKHQHRQLQQPGDADGGGDDLRGVAPRPAATPAARPSTAISATLNNSGENAVSAKRPCAFNSAIMTVTGPAKAR